jgi:hypothetical protein
MEICEKDGVDHPSAASVVADTAIGGGADEVAAAMDADVSSAMDQTANDGHPPPLAGPEHPNPEKRLTLPSAEHWAKVKLALELMAAGSITTINDVGRLIFSYNDTLASLNGLHVALLMDNVRTHSAPPFFFLFFFRD